MVSSCVPIPALSDGRSIVDVIRTGAAGRNRPVERRSECIFPALPDGGDEFCVMLADTEKSHAIVRAELCFEFGAVLGGSRKAGRRSCR